LLRTLHGYLTRDLLKATILSLVSFTLVMTVLAIIQPLRKMGLAGTQVLKLFAFTLPIVLSLTLPIGTLFAATLVYGRFSQDNELLASRASGISTRALLRPALVLGAVVTVLCLTLSNLVAPEVAAIAGRAKGEVRGFVYHRLKSRGHIDHSQKRRRYVVHADLVDADNDTLYGVMYAQIRDPKPSKDPNKPPKGGGVVVASASWAYLEFIHDGSGPSRVVIVPNEPSIVRLGENIAPTLSPDMGTARLVLPLELPIEEKPSWFSWHKLLATLAQPTLHSEVGRKLESIKQLICSDLLAKAVVDAVKAGRPYGELAKGDETYHVRAPAAEQNDEGEAVLAATPGPDGKLRLVTIEVHRRGRLVERVTARSGKVVVGPSATTRRPHVSLTLQGEVTTVFIGPEGERPPRRGEWGRGEIPVPAAVSERAGQIGLFDLYDRPEQFTQNRRIIEDINELRTTRIPRLRSALIAELHVRVAYGLSCFLMVAMGAALGTIFRGGQFLSAFAISSVPAVLVFAMLLMGREMIRNPDVEAAYGLAAIWGGIVAMLLANVAVYWRLGRR